MSKWQSYLDGSMPNDQRDLLDGVLEADPHARAQKEGLEQFQKSIREHCLKEDVPVGKLEGMLRDVVKSTQIRPKQIRFSRWLMYALPAAAAAIFAVIAFQHTSAPASIKFDDTPVVAVMPTTDAQQATIWLAKSTGHSAPLLALANLPQAEFQGTRYGRGWMAYGYKYKGQNYSIVCKQGANTINSLPCKVERSKEFYYSDSGVAWHCVANRTYMVTGGDNGGRWDIARRAAEETPNLIRG